VRDGRADATAVRSGEAVGPGDPLGLGAGDEGLEIPWVREEPESEGAAAGAEHRDLPEAGSDGGRLDVDEIRIAEVPPRRGLV